MSRDIAKQDFFRTLSPLLHSTNLSSALQCYHDRIAVSDRERKLARLERYLLFDVHPSKTTLPLLLILYLQTLMHYVESRRDCVKSLFDLPLLALAVVLLLLGRKPLLVLDKFIYIPIETVGKVVRTAEHKQHRNVLIFHAI